MTETIDAIQERLTPRRVMASAKDTVRDATIAGVKSVTRRTSDETTELANHTIARAAEIRRAIARNPVPFAIAGLTGLAVVARNRPARTLLRWAAGLVIATELGFVFWASRSAGADTARPEDSPSSGSLAIIP
jgi:hypothetical protein